MNHPKQAKADTETEVAAGATIKVKDWPLLPVSGEVYGRFQRTWSRRGNEFAQQIRQSADINQDELEDRLVGDERIGDLFAETLDRAARTADSEYRSTLACLVANAIIDVALLDEAEQLAYDLVNLGPHPLRTFLRIYAGHEESRRRAGNRLPRSPDGWEHLGLSPGPALQEALARLEGLSLVRLAIRVSERNRPAPRMPHLQETSKEYGADTYYVTTEWGVRAYELCTELVADEDTAPSQRT